MGSKNTFKVFCAISLFLTTVNSQQPIVNVKVIEDAKAFTITCDASRVSIPPTAGDVTYVSGLTLEIMNSTVPVYSLVAQYLTYGPVREIKNPPQGRNWVINLSGAGNETNNKNTMRIEILVREAMCTDAGSYRCSVRYLQQNGAETNAIVYQNVTAEAAITEVYVTLDPLNNGFTNVKNYSIISLNETVKATCQFDGPQNLTIKWKREARPARDVAITFEDYPYENDISPTETSSPTGSNACPQYHYTSVLTFAASELDKERIYLCVVQADRVDVAMAGATIDLTEAATSAPGAASAGGGGKPDIGLIVGVVIGCVAALVIIAIIIGVVCYRRRSKRDSYKDDTDRTDAGNSQYVPPPVTYARPNKAVNNNNRDSKALEDNEGHDKQHHNGYSNKRKEGKPYGHTTYTDVSYDQEQKPASRPRIHNNQLEDLHYASSDVSRSEDESAEQPIVPPGNSKSKPKSKPEVQPRRPQIKDEGRQLNYAQLDLPPSKIGSADNPGRRKPVEYAEISV